MNSNTPTVSVVIDRTVRSGKVAEFKRYQRSIIDAASKFPGFVGMDVVNPEGNNRYLLLFRFRSREELDAWSASTIRNFWVKKIDRVVQKPTELIALNGLETWFYLSSTERFVPPPKHKMGIVTYLALAPTVVIFNLLFGQFFSFMPEKLSIIATGPFIVLLMTYLAMPLMTKLFRNFLYTNNASRS